MKINKNELKSALEIVKPGLGENELIEQTTSFAFIGDKVVTYNDKMSISHPILDLQIKGAINAIELYQLISKIKSEEINIEINENQIILKAGRNKAGLILESVIKLPLEEIGELKGWKTLPEDFIEGLSFVLIACSNNENRPSIECVHIKDNGILESTDNLRIAQYELSSNLDIKTTLIHRDLCKEVIKLNPVKIAQTRGWIHFKTDKDTVISCRTYNATFPDISKIIECKGQAIQMPRVADSLIEKAMIFSYKGAKYIDIYIDEESIIIRGESITGSWFEGEGRIKYDGEPLAFSIMPENLKDILTKTNSLIIGDKTLKFESNKWIYITSIKYK